MPKNVRKAVSLAAFLFLLAALFPIQSEIVSVPVSGGIFPASSPYYYLTVLRAREVTLFWQPVFVPLRTYRGMLPGQWLRTELDWESCTLELVIIVSVGFLYFVWLVRRSA
jgi:hypothetical protein